MKISSDISAVLKLTLLIGFAVGLFCANGMAQKTEHYSSPLYSPKTYDPNHTESSNGLPPALKSVGIEQKLNSQLPLDAVMTAENGESGSHGEFFNHSRPVVLALVYYECPMLCNEVLNGLTDTIEKAPMEDNDIGTLECEALPTDLTDLAAM